MKLMQIIIPIYLPMEAAMETEQDNSVVVCIGAFICGIALGMLIYCLIENNPFTK